MSLLKVLFWTLSSITLGIISDAMTTISSTHPQLPFQGGAFNNYANTGLNGEALDILNHITVKDLNDTVDFAARNIGYMRRLEDNLLWANIKVNDGTPSHGMQISFGPEVEALERGKDALVALRATSQLVNTYCHRLFYANSLSIQECAKLMSRFKFHGTALNDTCRMLESVCEPEEYNSLYRSINGSCNNILKGHQGESFTGYSRLLYADYADGVHEIRRSVSKKPLPNARHVVSSLIKTGNRPSNRYTLALMQWSQFLEHDLCRSATAVTNNSIECCSEEGKHLTPRYIHPFCSPIYVPDDKKYADEGVNCLSFVRSIPAIRADCSFGASDQVNQATHYLDGSQIYGSTTRKSNELRQFIGGRLLTSKYEHRSYLPLSRNPTHDCHVFSETSTCFESGDARVNFQPQLALLHTIWYREHNRIAKILAKLNPQWGDEGLFQEARRIVIAEMQRITYNEWIPAILGKSLHDKIESSSKYQKTIDPSISNGFVTAVMRTLKSLSDGSPKLYNEQRQANDSIFMRNYFHNPGLLRHAGVLDSFARGLTTQSSQRLDVFYADDLINQLYTNGKFGFDVLSFDLQRGRDHGLPGYNKYRKLCGLRRAEHFTDFLDVINQQDIMALQRLYTNPDDVDLMIGGLLEKVKGDSLVGPTFSCIVADQMLRTRQGDRYFYTNDKQPKPFTKQQINEIDKVSLAKVICDNSDNIEHMQKRVLEQVDDHKNPLVTCKSIPPLNLIYWQEFDANNLL